MLVEPTAAAIAAGFHNSGDGEKNVLVFDYGGGTFDITILIANEGNYNVESTRGDLL